MAVTAEQVKQLVRRRGALAAAVTALSVVAALLAQGVLRQLISLISVAANPGLYDVAFLGLSWANVALSFLTTGLPFGVGFFLSLWLLAPIADELRLPHVITRSVLATGVGATVLFVVQAVIVLVQAIGRAGSLFGNSFPSPDGSDLLMGWANALTGALTLFVMYLPLGVLAGVLLWLWRRAHPAKFRVEGLIDV